MEIYRRKKEILSWGLCDSYIKTSLEMIFATIFFQGNSDQWQDFRQVFVGNQTADITDCIFLVSSRSNHDWHHDLFPLFLKVIVFMCRTTLLYSWPLTPQFALFVYFKHGFLAFWAQEKCWMGSCFLHSSLLCLIDVLDVVRQRLELEIYHCLTAKWLGTIIGRSKENVKVLAYLPSRHNYVLVRKRKVLSEYFPDNS